MPLLGNGALVFWNGVEAGNEVEFDRWHIEEHMPERLAIPGFLRGRRYTVVNGGPRYFTLYETASVDTLGSTAYLARLNDPTEWTKRIFAVWRDSNRTACTVTASLGQGIGGALVTIELGPRPGRADELRDRLVQSILPRLAATPHVVGVHFCEADTSTSQIQTAEKRERGDQDASAQWVVLVEGTTVPAVEAAVESSEFVDDVARHGGEVGRRSSYQLVYVQDGTAE